MHSVESLYMSLARLSVIAPGADESEPTGSSDPTATMKGAIVAHMNMRRGPVQDMMKADLRVLGAAIRRYGTDGVRDLVEQGAAVILAHRRRLGPQIEHALGTHHLETSGAKMIRFSQHGASGFARQMDFVLSLATRMALVLPATGSVARPVDAQLKGAGAPPVLLAA